MAVWREAQQATSSGYFFAIKTFMNYINIAQEADMIWEHINICGILWRQTQKCLQNLTLWE
jgi:hypothetical protein